MMARLLGSLRILALVVAAMLPSMVQAAAGQPWVLVNTKKLMLTVYGADGQVIARFPDISIGSGGTSREHMHGDETTPLGTFHVRWIDRHSRFLTFFGLDYPTAGAALRAYAAGRITAAQCDAITGAFRDHRVPPQNTPLGGQIGIHGVGGGLPWVQGNANWTDGCVAVTNPEIRKLARWVHVGTKVVIR